MIKILKNTTASEILIDCLGLSIPALDQIEVDKFDYSRFDKSLTISSLIESGGIVVNNGLVDLDVYVGLSYILDIDNTNSGLSRIEVNTGKIISENHQVVLYEELVVEGEIDIEGFLIIED